VTALSLRARDADVIDTELAVIGAGMAGLAAELFASNRGVATLVIGGPSELRYASGPFDLLAIHPTEQRKLWSDPFAGIEALVHDHPLHPYARLSRESIGAAFSELLLYLAQAGLPYERHVDRNCELVTSLGTVKHTYCVPRSMWPGVLCWQSKPECLFVALRGMKDFSARHIVAALADQWPAARALRISLPGAEDLTELSADYAARCCDLPEIRARLAQAILPELGTAKAVGLPAVLGFARPTEAIADLEQRLGVPVFEIPIPPVSVPGLRLAAAFERQLRARGQAAMLLHNRVLEAKHDDDGSFLLEVGTTQARYAVRAKAVLLATGRFLGKGLEADRQRIRETLFDLPVHQPASRAEWHRLDMLDPRGHPVSQAGLETDEHLRPLGASGRAAFPTLFAAGSILAHQDWTRSKCGSGLAIATAYGAVSAYCQAKASGQV